MTRATRSSQRCPLALKRNLLIKDNGARGILVLLPDTDQMIQLQGDIGRLIVLIQKLTLARRSWNPTTLRKELSRTSESFRKNEHQEECIAQGLSFFEERGFFKEEG